MRRTTEIVGAEPQRAQGDEAQSVVVVVNRKQVRRVKEGYVTQRSEKDNTHRIKGEVGLE